jgi:hypothetical protein
VVCGSICAIAHTSARLIHGDGASVPGKVDIEMHAAAARCAVASLSNHCFGTARAFFGSRMTRLVQPANSPMEPTLKVVGDAVFIDILFTSRQKSSSN